MKRAYIAAIIALLFGWAATLAVDAYDRRSGEALLAAEAEARLKDRARRLENELDAVLRDSGSMAARLAAMSNIETDTLRHIAAGVAANRPWVVSVVLSRDLTVFFVHPIKGNESVLGLNYNYRPDFLGGIQRAISLRKGIVTGPARLVQSGRQGLIIRDPIFRETENTEGAPGGSSVFWGMASIAIDMENLFKRAGLIEADAFYNLAIRAQAADGTEGETFFGDAKLFQSRHVSAEVNLPDGKWRIVATVKPEMVDNLSQSARIRQIGAVLTLALAAAGFLWGRMSGKSPADGQGQASWRRGEASLRAVLSAALLLLLIPVAGGIGRLSFHAAEELADQFTARLAEEVGKRIHDKVTAFFDLPQSIIAFNVDQARAGLLHTEDGDLLTRMFLLQLRQQPLLTFVSMGSAEGDYFGASRPPLGIDKNPRIMEARSAENYEMRIFGIDDANRRGELLTVAGSRFDARTRPWFRSAAASGVMSWYPPYRYSINDGAGAYDTYGIGMSAPIFDGKGTFLGVVAADMALSQLGEFLKTAAGDTGGAAFLMEDSGKLLATSTEQPIFSFEGDVTIRVAAQDSAEPVIRVAGQAVRAAAQPEGRLAAELGDSRLIVQWRRLQLPYGPGLTIGVALPEDHFAAPLRRGLNNVAALGAAILLISFIIALLATDWVSRPLTALNHWANRLAGGEWSAETPAPGPIYEVRSLSAALGRMATRLRSYTEELERRVRERTEALEAANQKLSAISATDSLTGLANRRRFDDVLAVEWARAQRSGAPPALLMIDVDFFKQFNDRYGHPAGDDCLRRLATTLQSCARRAGDLPARYGGEEFAVIAADMNATEAQRLAEKIRNNVAALGIPHDQSPYGVVTVSIGVALAVPDGRMSPDALLQAADTALYRAKQSGRNLVEGPPPPVFT
jgi:diguanylate cyclase (GGDEF)-like protein